MTFLAPVKRTVRNNERSVRAPWGLAGADNAPPDHRARIKKLDLPRGFHFKQLVDAIINIKRTEQ